MSLNVRILYFIALDSIHTDGRLLFGFGLPYPETYTQRVMSESISIGQSVRHLFVIYPFMGDKLCTGWKGRNVNAFRIQMNTKYQHRKWVFVGT